jgi:hypothetical protein
VAVEQDVFDVYLTQEDLLLPNGYNYHKTSLGGNQETPTLKELLSMLQNH